MTIDEAVIIAGAENVVGILNSGRAHDRGRLLSFHGEAVRAAIRGDTRAQSAFVALGAAREIDVRQACKSRERLEREFLRDGSGRAMNELLRRGWPLPQAADLLPARL